MTAIATGMDRLSDVHINCGITSLILESFDSDSGFARIPSLRQPNRVSGHVKAEQAVVVLSGPLVCIGDPEGQAAEYIREFRQHEPGDRLGKVVRRLVASSRY